MKVRWAVVTVSMLAASRLGTPASAQVRNSDTAGNWVADCERQRGDQERFCEVRLSGFKGMRGTLSADGGQNGGAKVIGWDKDSVGIEARIQVGARTRDEAKRIASQIRIVTDGGRIRAEGPSAEDEDFWSVMFVLFVPRTSNLELTSHNGPVEVNGVTGTMELRTQNGPVVLSQVGGDVRARTENGPLEVTLSGSSWSGKGLDAVTSNGPVELTLPTDYNAHLETGTVNGPLDVQFPITVTHFDKRNVTVDLGKSGPTVRAITTNGPVGLYRASDSDKDR